MKFVRNAKYSYIITSALMIVLGLLLVIFPSISATVVCYLAGGMVTLFGIVKLVGYFSKDMFRLAFQFDFAMGIGALIAGILMLIHPHNVVRLIPIIVGVFILIDGALKLQTARDAKRFGMKGWWSILILAILTCIGGLFLIIDPFKGASALMILLGATFMMYGIQNLAVTAYTVRVARAEDERPGVYYVDGEEKKKDK